MKLSKSKKIIIGASTLLLVVFYFCLPRTLFQDPFSTVLLSAESNLLGAQIANDGQWRFPPSIGHSEKFEQAILTFEDKRFYKHFGFDPLAFARAIKLNIKSGKIVSGGSTLSMQTIRLSRKGKPRSFYQKIIEIILATRLEFGYSKKEILNLYSSHAPFGGNVVGLQTASWRYFGISPELLSWGQAACLAVLPNSPGLIHPGRNRNTLKTKRNKLLDQMQTAGIIDATTCYLAKLESIPDAPLPLPRLAPHFLHQVKKRNTDRIEKLNPSTLKIDIQNQLINIANKHKPILAGNSIHNLSILVLDNKKNEVVGYLGNLPGTGKSNQESVDIIHAKRSTGSVLKPLLYGWSMEDAVILPKTLLSDIPTSINGYRPENFFKAYSGAIPADEALAKSLNIPFVKLLQEYQTERFWKRLGNMGIHSIQRKSPDNYGLTLILGGAEASLWEMTNTYAQMAKDLMFYNENSSRYPEIDHLPLFFPTPPNSKGNGSLLGKSEPNNLSAGSIWQTFEAMKELERPSDEGNWEFFHSSGNIAWKTGTSIGFRDAWAIGVTPDYSIGVWVGNADGEGRPGLIGARAAGPILFDAFRIFPTPKWFEQPFDDMSLIAVCKESGNRASTICPTDSTWVPNKSLTGPVCKFHEMVHINESGEFRVHKDCVEKISESKSQFILPPVESHYYSLHQPDYELLPNWHPSCVTQLEHQPISMIYPLPNAQIKLPVDLDGITKPAIFEAAHLQIGKKIYWQLNDDFIGETENFHSLEINVPIGQYRLTLTDEDGNQLQQSFSRI